MNIFEKSKNSDTPVIADMLLLSNPYSNNKNNNSIKTSTRLAYSMLTSKNRYYYAFGLIVAVSISFCALLSLAFFSVNQFIAAFNLSFLLADGEQYIQISQISSSFMTAWICLIMMFICTFVFFVSTLISIKCLRIIINFNRNGLIITPLSNDN